MEVRAPAMNWRYYAMTISILTVWLFNYLTTAIPANAAIMSASTTICNTKKPNGADNVSRFAGHFSSARWPICGYFARAFFCRKIYQTTKESTPAAGRKVRAVQRLSVSSLRFLPFFFRFYFISRFRFVGFCRRINDFDLGIFDKLASLRKRQVIVVG